MTSTRSSPESNRNGASLVDYEQILPKEDRAEVAIHIQTLLAAPGPALLVWGPDAIILGYNRAYRGFAAYRTSALERPLFKAQPELERTWRARLDQALGGTGAVLDPSDCVPASGHEAARSGSGGAAPASAPLKAASSAGDVRSGWILPVGLQGGRAKGALILLMDVTLVVEPLRRAVALVAVELRESLIGVRVISERIARAPKINPERFLGDVGRIREMTGGMERTADDMTTFSRFAGGPGVQVSPRPGDLGALVRAACDELAAAQAEPRPAASTSTSTSTWLRVNVVSVMGAWDPDAIHRVVINLVTAARRCAVEGSEVAVELISGREGAALMIRAEGKAPREDELDAVFEPWKRAAPPSDRRAGSGLGLFVARELILAHGGRLSWEQGSPTTFVLRVLLPPASPPASRWV